jgi:hypothetical protein
MWMGNWTAYIKDARRNYVAWEERFDRAWKEDQDAKV